MRRLFRRVAPDWLLPVLLRLHRGLRRLTRRDVARPSDFYPQFRAAYGDFQVGEDYDELTIWGLEAESGGIRGSIVHLVRELPAPDRVLLPGEYNRTKDVYSRLLGVPATAIVTAGIDDDTDYRWDFERDPPEMGDFDLSISEAMLEHLIAPYKHVRDLAAVTRPGGHVVLATHPPGFPYHRYPVDCLRFWPDWFEEVADRIGFRVVARHIDDATIDYVLQRPPGT